MHKKRDFLIKASKAQRTVQFKHGSMHALLKYALIAIKHQKPFDSEARLGSVEAHTDGLLHSYNVAEMSF